jgi:cardiolipin synthase
LIIWIECDLCNRLYYCCCSRTKRNNASLHELPYRKDGDSNPIETVLASHGIAGTTLHNEILLYFDGIDAHTVLLNEILNARESIWISTYHFKNDATTKTILKALTQKAAQGVDVKLLMDAVGSYPLYFWQRPLRALRVAGGKAVFFMPILKDPFKNYINLRNHRKIYLFDQRTVLAGGMNLSKKYLGAKPLKKRWIDMIFRIKGEAAFSYADIFSADFEYASGEKILPTKKETEAVGVNPIQVVPSGPDISSDALYETLLSAIHSAEERIWIVTPYFVPDDTIMKALIIAKHKGIDVRLITPGISDHWIVDIARSSYMREFEEKGITVLLHNGNMLHTKAVLFDEYAVMLGSVNIDNRSLFLNYEVVSFVYAKPVIDEVDAWIRGLIQHSTPGMKKGSRKRVILENFMRIFSPQL